MSLATIASFVRACCTTGGRPILFALYHLNVNIPQARATGCPAHGPGMHTRTNGCFMRHHLNYAPTWLIGTIVCWLACGHVQSKDYVPVLLFTCRDTRVSWQIHTALLPCVDCSSCCRVFCTVPACARQGIRCPPTRIRTPNQTEPSVSLVCSSSHTLISLPAVAR